MAKGDPGAREKIIELVDSRLRFMARRLLGDFPRVHRWETTNDVAQNAAIRLHRALGEVQPASARGLIGLMALQIQRELLDLARKYAGPTSFATNQDTNVRRTTTGGQEFHVEAAPDTNIDAIPLERWEQFHCAVDALPDDLREVFRMAWYLGLDQTEVAQTLGCSTRTVGRKWQEARSRIQEVLGTGDD